MPEDRIMVLHNGVDLDRFHPKRRLHEGRKLRTQLNIPADAPVVLFVGRGFRRKGLDRLLALWQRNKMPGVCLLVVGHDAKLSHYRKRWSCKNEVIFAGPQEKIEDYYAAADLLVLPAIQEAFGNVTLEALASGLPVVTVAGVGAMDHVNGLLCEGILSDPDDPAELKAKILRMLDPRRWPCLAREARQTAAQNTWDHYFDQLENILLDCSRQSPTAHV
jgi:UDP-glucose:(heptosyl)LPS alpha-1,3-glucosyltransferase